MINAPSTRIALEHTRVESYTEQIADDHRIQWLVDLELELQDQLPPPGCYIVVIAPGATKGVRDPVAVKSALLDWVLANAGGSNSVLQDCPPSPNPRETHRRSV